MPVPSAKHYQLSGEKRGRAALLMAAEERDSGAGLSLRRASRMEDDFGVETLSCFGYELCSMNSSGALRQAGAFLMD